MDWGGERFSKNAGYEKTVMFFLFFSKTSSCLYLLMN